MPCLCQDLKPDWNLSRTEFISRNVCNWIKTTFSKTLERKGKWETGLKLESTEGSRCVFFRRGLTKACLAVISKTSDGLVAKPESAHLPHLLPRVWWVFLQTLLTFYSTQGQNTAQRPYVAMETDLTWLDFLQSAALTKEIKTVKNIL